MGLGSRNILCAAGLLLGLCLASSADTLQMKDGNVVRGRYLGGSERAVQFEVNGKIELYNVDQVLSITFTGAPAAGFSQPRSEDHRAVSEDNPSGKERYRGASVTVPAGTRILVRMIDSVDSSS